MAAHAKFYAYEPFSPELLTKLESNELRQRVKLFARGLEALAALKESPHLLAANLLCTENQLATIQEVRAHCLCRLLPQPYQEAILGDILEECRDRSDRGATEKEIRRYISWEILLAAAHSWPAALVAIVKRVFSTK